MQARDGALDDVPRSAGAAAGTYIPDSEPGAPLQSVSRVGGPTENPVGAGVGGGRVGGRSGAS